MIVEIIAGFLAFAIAGLTLGVFRNEAIMAFLFINDDEDEGGL